MEERAYAPFLVAGLAATLGGGLVLGSLARLDPGRLVPAHGFLQVAGFAGLIVAGMGLRLVPRQAGVRPPPGSLVLAVFALLATGTGLGLAGRLVAGPPAVAGLLEHLLLGTGRLAVAAVLAWSLLRGRGRGAGWWLAAWPAAGWWAAWALLPLGEATALLGAVVGMVWSVQARTVPVFFGRRPPRGSVLALPLAAFHGGVLAQAAGRPALGAVLLGLGTASLAVLTGALGGVAHRLRAPARAPAGLVLDADRWALVAAVLWVGSAPGRPSGAGWWPPDLGDAALHAMALGLVTTLIVGMSELIAPVFAGARATSPPAVLRACRPLLAVAVALRLGADLVPAAGADGLLVPLSGTLAWLALAAFAVGMVRAARAGYPALPSPAS